MRPPPRFLAAALLAACHAGPPTADDACPIAARVQLAAAPPGFTPEPDTYYDLLAVGDHLLYTFDPPLSQGRTYWHKHRCGGEPEPFRSLVPGLHHPFSIDTPDGPVLYARDLSDRTFVVDRLDDPGADVPRPVQDLPVEALSLFPGTGRRYVNFSELIRFNETIRRAAGLDGTTYAEYTHAGDPEVPAARVGLDVVALSLLDDRLLALDDDGTLRSFDPFTAASTTLLTGVRHYDLAPDRRRLVWQAIGDDLAEPVHLHDLDTGEGREIAVNDLAPASWGRTEDDDTIGDWSWTTDGAATVMLGPARTLVTAVRTDTGAALAIPDHIEYTGSHDRHLALVLPDPADHVEALWHPLTGELREFYRGPLDPRLFRVDGDLVEYTLTDPADDQQLGLWRVDLRTGDRTELIPPVRASIGRLDDRRYILTETTGYLPKPPLGDFVAQAGIADITVVDLDTGVHHLLAGSVYARRSYPDEGLVYLDVFGPDPGVWAVPYPK